MNQLRSERVIVQSPMSFVGSYHRAMKLKSGTGGFDGFMRALIAWTVLLIWWIPVAVWTIVAYTIALPLTIIWRLMRRSNRKAKQDRLRHQELLAASQPPARGTDIAPL